MIFYTVTLCLFLSYQKTVLANNETFNDTLYKSFIKNMVDLANNQTFNYTLYKSSMENLDLFEGDIRLDTSFGESRAVVWNHRVWDNGIIYYKFSPDIKVTRILYLLTSFRYIELVTCLRFVYRKTEENYIFIQEGDGCNSHVGKIGGRQILNLDSGCWYFGVILHEVCHAIGLYHEHTRPDRDKYIKILWDNIIDEFKTEFQVINKYHLRICDKYSYGSIMHYGPKEFAKDGKVSFVPTLPNVTIKEVYDRLFLSQSDIGCINKLYKCQ
ncbi:astacin-like metalloprotease toxin 5 isoform X2 [Centruroides vittatus]|uniref:astacin-like metalloprotease toxin 5 isoform X2 n=1 Tax=Centruroides vittatus TaxID=120091 RepID=UPI00350EEA2D